MSRVVLADVAGHGEVVSSVADRLRTRKHVDTWPQSILLAGQFGPVFVCCFYWRSAPTPRRLVAVSTMVSATGRDRHPRSRSALALENRRFLPNSNS